MRNITFYLKISLFFAAMCLPAAVAANQSSVLRKLQACLKPEIHKQYMEKHSVESKAPYLNVYNWSGYLPIAVLEAFTKETGIRVNYSTYDSNETLYTKLKANPNSEYDVIVPSSYFVERMIKNKMLQKLDRAQLPNVKYLDSNLLNKTYDPENQYSIPYLWSSTGIVVNTRKHAGELDQLYHWESLWSPKFASQLLLLDDAREVFAIALLALGFSPNTQNPEHIKSAYLKLRELMPNVRVFSTDGITALYVDEDLSLGMGWNGDADRIRQENKAVSFIYPKEGFILSIDSFAIPKGSRHAQLAHQFINFMCRPDIAAQITMETGFPSANQEARKMLEKNSTLHPDGTLLKQGIILQDVEKQVELYEQYWQLLKIN